MKACSSSLTNYFSWKRQVRQDACAVKSFIKGQAEVQTHEAKAGSNKQAKGSGDVQITLTRQGNTRGKNNDEINRINTNTRFNHVSILIICICWI